MRYRSLTLPLIANPTIPLSGMVGESKADILDQLRKPGRQWLCHYITQQHDALQPAHEEANAVLARYQQEGMQLPAVVKPDLGCRGAGVRLIERAEQLGDYLADFPNGARYLLQERSRYQAEAGVFYVRYPGESQGKIISITLKYTPWVVGDGKQTLRELILADERAGQLSHIYLPRHPEHLDRVLEEGEVFRLAFAGSHSRGSIFRNGNGYITDQLTQRLDQIFNDFPTFHYGRLDIKFRDIEALMKGEDFQILEINGASSEATHIWDSRTRFRDAITTLMSQYRILFEIGHKQRMAGHASPSLMSLYRAWREEKRWVQDYPSTD